MDEQRGINAFDHIYNKINLAKGITQTLGMGFYPKDLTKEEFHKILI